MQSVVDFNTLLNIKYFESIDEVTPIIAVRLTQQYVTFLFSDGKWGDLHKSEFNKKETNLFDILNVYDGGRKIQIGQYKFTAKQIHKKFNTKLFE
jgi:hypothetical protein